MKIVFYLNVISPHQLPLAEALIEIVGEDNFRYVYKEKSLEERTRMGWDNEGVPLWCVPFGEAQGLLESADLLYSGIRDIELFERRSKAGRRTFYCSERWLKPIRRIPGRIRMLVPHYRRMVRRFATWLDSDPYSMYLAIGPWAEKDMRWLGVKADKILPWGYYVEPSRFGASSSGGCAQGDEIRLLWVGRFIDWKCVGDIVHAVDMNASLGRVDGRLPKIVFDLYGCGPEEEKLKKLVTKLGLDSVVHFHPPVPIAEVRYLMRSHDVYVLSSNAYEGWGAVVSEALEEGMKVVGTYEAGSSAAILPETNLYHSGDWRRLAELLRGNIQNVSIGQWTAKSAARRMLAMIGL